MATNLTKLNVAKLNTRIVNVKECYDPANITKCYSCLDGHHL